MKISYDSEVDALYIRLVDGPQECRTVRLAEEMALNIGPGEKLVGIEVLDAKEVLGAGQLPKLAVENVPFWRCPKRARRVALAGAPTCILLAGGFSPRTLPGNR